MGVYIDMEMPKNCTECSCLNDEYWSCQASKMGLFGESADKKRPDWCPLVPAADVRPVVRGKWVLEYEPNGKPYCFHCSVCDGDFHYIGITTKYDFCPNCGADMREESW